MQSISNVAMFAEPTLSVSEEGSHIEESAKSFTLDTTFVLFFLAMDLGLSAISWDLTSALSLATLGVFLLVPYFLPFSGVNRNFGRWLAGRIIVAVTGGCLGLMFGQAVGVLFPEAFRFVPMTLLIVAAIICCNVQIYGILKNRLAR
jgi:hypothetical protein